MKTNRTIRPTSSRLHAQVLLLILVVGLSLPLSAHAQETCTSGAPDWCVNPADYQSNMSVTSQLFFGGLPSTDTGDLVAAFVGSEVRGWVAGSAFGAEMRNYLTVYGNTNGETLTFKAYDASAGEVRPINESMSFTSDDIVGSPGTPFLFHAPGGEVPGQITLNAPSDGASSLPVDPSVTLSWNETADATSYDLQVDDNNDFSSPEIDQSGLTGSPYDAVGLARGTTYYWRARGGNGNGQGAWSDPWHFTTLVNEPGSGPSLTTPADGANLNTLTPTLTWQALGDADTYDVQLASDAAFTTLLIDATGLTSTQHEVPGGTLAFEQIYFWRARGLNEGGPGPWTDAFSFQTLEPPPDTPSPVAPANGAVALPVTVTLQWTEPERATFYALQVATDANFSTLIVDQDGLANPGYQVTNLLFGTIYFWRVQAGNATGVSDWSTVFSFVTMLVAPFEAPLLTAPDEGAVTSLRPSLQWDEVANASAYDVQLSTSIGFGTIAHEASAVSATKYRPGQGKLEEQETYHWRVRGTNSAGAGPWSAIRRFTTQQVGLDAPVLTTPADEAIEQPLTLDLAWEASTDATYYDVQVATDEGFTQVTVDQTSLTTLTVTVDVPTPATTYFWRVRAGNASEQSDWSNTRRFTTIPVQPGTAPTTATPADGATTGSLTPTLTWVALAGAATYDVQLSTQSDFSKSLALIAEATNLNQTHYTVAEGALAPAATYYWRVRGTNSAGAGPWSATMRFNTPQDASGVPSLAEPVDGALEQPTQVTLQWHPASGASFYDVRLATDAAFTHIVLDQRGIHDLRLDVTDLQPSTVYYWQVLAVNPSGVSAWSDPFHFTTQISAPQLLEPTDGTMVASLSPTLQWAVINGADQYTLALSTSADFSMSILFTGVTASAQQVFGLMPGTLYYWRVRSSNALTESAWSVVFTFTTPQDTNTAVETRGTEVPDGFTLEQNYPNPFNPTTTIRFGLPEATQVQLDVFDAQGRKVAELVRSYLAAGWYEAPWEAPLRTASGIYFYRLITGTNILTGKMMLLK